MDVKILNKILNEIKDTRIEHHSSPLSITIDRSACLMDIYNPYCVKHINQIIIIYLLIISEDYMYSECLNIIHYCKASLL